MMKIFKIHTQWPRKMWLRQLFWTIQLLPTWTMNIIVLVIWTWALFRHGLRSNHFPKKRMDFAKLQKQSQKYFVKYILGLRAYIGDITNNHLCNTTCALLLMHYEWLVICTFTFTFVDIFIVCLPSEHFYNSINRYDINKYNQLHKNESFAQFNTSVLCVSFLFPLKTS